MNLSWQALLIVPMSIATSASSEPSKEAMAFGAREAIRDISLSPDGAQIAMIRPEGTRGSKLVVADLAGGATKAILHASGNPDQLTDCQWTATTRLVCRISLTSDSNGQLLGFTRLIAIDADGENIKQLTQSLNLRSLGILQDGGDVIDLTGDGSNGSILYARRFVPESSIGTRLASSADGMGVEAVDTRTLSRRVIERARPQAVEYISDGRGQVRIMGTMVSSANGYLADKISYSYRARASHEWTPLSEYRFESGTGFNPIAVDPDLNAVYGFEKENGLRKLVRRTLDGGMARQVVAGRPDVDVDGLIRIGRQRRVVGATWTGEKRDFEFFDTELKDLSAALGKALPGHPEVRFVDASTDEKSLLLFAGNDDDPGRYYVYRKDTRKLEEILPARPELVGKPLAKMTPVSYRAADGTLIPAYLTLPPDGARKGLPAIVLPHGGPSARDEWGFDWLPQFFAARGYAVLQPQYRGSAGYGDAWFQKNGFQSWRAAINDIGDGGRWLIAQGIATPDRLAVVGWSYGGYAALQSGVVDPTLFKAIVAIAPVTDLEMLRGEARRFSNFAMVDSFIGNGPHIREGSPARNAGAITAPVLLFHGDRDMNVGVGESRLMAGQLRGAKRPVEYVEFAGLDHYLDDVEARTTMLDRIDVFLRQHPGR